MVRPFVTAGFIMLALLTCSFSMAAGVADSGAVQSTGTPLRPITVNGVEIPVTELQLILRDRGVVNGPISAQALSEAQSMLVSRELAAAAARKEGLDQDPVVATRMRMAAQDVLASAYHVHYLRNHPIDENEVRAVYDDLASRAGDKEYRVSQIFVTEERVANSILEELKDGKPFAEAARERSIDAASRDRGGDLGWLSALLIQKEFVEPIRALTQGEIADTAVSGPNGWHIFMVTGTRDLVVEPYETSRVALRMELQKKQLLAHMRQLLNQSEVLKNEP